MKKFENVYQDAALMRRVLLGEADEAEQQELEKRLEECSDLRKIYEQLQNSETLKAAFKERQNYSSKKAYQSFLQKIGQVEPERQRRRSLHIGWYIAAAVVIFAVGLSFYMLNSSSPKEESRPLIQPGTQQAQLTLPDGSVIDVDKKEVNVVVDGIQVKYKEGVLSYQSTVTTQHEEKNVEEQSAKSNELVIPRGGENTVILADGTTVHLNAGSKLTYPVRFVGKRRLVALEGEAYFDVAEDENHPFVVQTHLGDVIVLGTAFNVNAYINASVCYTTLVRGKVKFSAPNVEAITLLPGEQAVVSANGSEKRTVDLEEYVGWVEGLYVFNNRSLGEIMETFERWYDIQVYYETEDLRNITYSGSLKRYGTINSFLEALELTGDLTYKISGRNILIYGKMED
ncbi:FecR domain-containing protein [uncultured Bacteroides sp.]|uniref:FecR domain-containing protein n=1 Tax=uncultured Bacteroides sp. TaxID=162156 RepID=UPI000822EE4D|nr:FecR domain-containing protein [uncultured Bacteroides sp.]SCH56609.1 fec operon regulator FecR [uncultured Bacteroides sp.]